MECFICSEKASHECLCLQKSIPFCKSCLTSHVTSNLSIQHNIQELSSKNINPLCFECSSKICEVICLCKRIGLCRSCLRYHCSGTGSHFLEYIRLEKQSKDTFDMENRPNSESIKHEVVENLRHLEEFQQTVINSREMLIEAIKKAAEDLIISTERSKIKLNSALDIIKTNKFPREDQWPYNYKKRQGCMTPSRRSVTKEIKLCETELRIEPIMKAIKELGKVLVLGDTPQKEINLYYFRPKPKEMICVDLNSFYIVKKIFPRNLLLADASSWCEGPQKQIIFCGGVRSNVVLAECYVIDPISMNFKQLPNMKYPRAMAAVAFHNNSFYAFGGYSGYNLDTCEKFNFTTGKWEELPRMPVARSAFTIVVEKNNLYLCGDSTRLDAFDTESGQFIDTGITIPEASYSSLVNIDGDLILIQNESCLEISLKTMQVRKICSIIPGKWWSCFPPFFIENTVIFARYDDGFLYSIDLANKVLTKKIKLIG